MDVELVKLKCKSCEWEWLPRHSPVKTCPRCKSKFWNEGRQRRRVVLTKQPVMPQIGLP